jgi:serine/threonine protein kinase
LTPSKRLRTGSELGAYRLESLIGAGGMGEVYRAKDVRLGRWVAIKVLLPQISADVDARRRFEREARAIANLNHPNICTLHDIGSEDGVDYIVMEYLEGDTLAGFLATRRLPMDRVLGHGIAIASALAAAHKQSIVHRDLKPGNIILTKSGIKVLDFGIAKFLDANAVVLNALRSADLVSDAWRYTRHSRARRIRLGYLAVRDGAMPSTGARAGRDSAPRFGRQRGEHGVDRARPSAARRHRRRGGNDTVPLSARPRPVTAAIVLDVARIDGCLNAAPTFKWLLKNRLPLRSALTCHSPGEGSRGSGTSRRVG